MSVLREVAPAHQLRMQIAELEEANSELSARLQVRRRARMGGSSEHQCGCAHSELVVVVVHRMRWTARRGGWRHRWRRWRAS